MPNCVQIFVGVISVSFYIYRHNIYGDRFYEANDKSVYHYYGIILQLVLYDRRRLSQLGPSKTGHSHHYQQLRRSGRYIQFARLVLHQSNERSVVGKLESLGKHSSALWIPVAKRLNRRFMNRIVEGHQGSIACRATVIQTTTSLDNNIIISDFIFETTYARVVICPATKNLNIILYNKKNQSATIIYTIFRRQ